MRCPQNLQATFFRRNLGFKTPTLTETSIQSGHINIKRSSQCTTLIWILKSCTTLHFSRSMQTEKYTKPQCASGLIPS